MSSLAAGLAIGIVGDARRMLQSHEDSHRLPDAFKNTPLPKIPTSLPWTFRRVQVQGFQPSAASWFTTRAVIEFLLTRALRVTRALRDHPSSFSHDSDLRQLFCVCRPLGARVEKQRRIWWGQED